MARDREGSTVGPERYQGSFDSVRYINGIWTADGKTNLDDVGEFPPFSEWVYESFLTRVSCPHCGSELELATYDNSASDPEPEGRSVYKLWSCFNCAYWQSSSFDGNPDLERMIAASTLRSFERCIPEGCCEALAQHLRASPERWRDIAPRDLELLVRDIWRANYSNADVMHVGKTGDKGEDVLFVESNNDQTCIQVKGHLTSTEPEGFETFQKLLGTMLLKGRDRGIIVTTASRFTSVVKEDAEGLLRRGITVRLVDRGKLTRMLEGFLPVSPWRSFLGDVFPYLGEFPPYDKTLSEVVRYFDERLKPSQVRIL